MCKGVKAHYFIYCLYKMIFEEKTKKQIKKEKEDCLKYEKQKLLDLLYELFEFFEKNIHADNFDKIDDYIISITRLLLIIEENHFISVHELDKKLHKFESYKTFKAKNASMKSIKNNKSDGGGGFLHLAILGIGIAASLVNLTYAAIGTTVGALNEDRMVKGFDSLEKARAFKIAMENTGGSCFFNTELQTKDKSEFNKTVDIFEKTHAPIIIEDDIKDFLNNNPGATYEDYVPYSHRFNIKGTLKYIRENNITINATGNDHSMNDGKIITAHNEKNLFKSWEDTLKITRVFSEKIYSNWEKYTSPDTGDICIFFMGFREFDVAHAFNGLVRKVGEEYKVGAIDSNDYTNLIDIDSNDNIVSGKAYRTGWIRVEEGFFTPEEEKQLGDAVIITDNPFLSVFDRYKQEINLFGYNLYKYRDWNKPTSVFAITFENNMAEENYGNFPTPTTGNMAIVDFGVTQFEAFIEAKNMINRVASSYFEAIEKHPGSTFGGKKISKKRLKKRTRKTKKKRNNEDNQI